MKRECWICKEPKDINEGKWLPYNSTDAAQSANLPKFVFVCNECNPETRIAEGNRLMKVAEKYLGHKKPMPRREIAIPLARHAGMLESNDIFVGEEGIKIVSISTARVNKIFSEKYGKDLSEIYA